MKRKTKMGILQTLGVLLTLIILLNVQSATIDAQGSYPESLVLWNKLGSLDEVQNSLIGQGFNVNPVVGFVPGLYGGALATESECGYLSMDPDDFFPSDKTQGTVEVWIQKRMQEFFPFTTPLVGIFGNQPYGDLGCGSHGYNSIYAYWSDGYTGNGGIQFQVKDSDNNWHTINDLGWNDVAVGEWVHMAFVWDLDGIDGSSSDTLRIYRDGVVVASTTEAIPGIMQDSNDVRLLGHHAYYRFGQPTAYMDNIKVWDYAKADFADRFKEEPNLPPNCDTALPSVDTLWPPNHKFVSVEVVDITDPDGDQIAITITGIWQDEAVDASGSGNTKPDGQGVDTSIAEVRAERVGSDNGRVYHINFTVDDGYGGMCSGEVLVGVPHNKKSDPIDDGPLYDSTMMP